MTKNALIHEMSEALKSEIKALKDGKGGKAVKLFYGRLTREVSGLFIYRFHLENFLAAVDDSPAEIEIGDKKYKCQIITIQSLEVDLSLEKHLGETVAEALLQNNSWYLHELLCKKYEEALSSGADFTSSMQLFRGVSKSLDTPTTPNYLILDAPPNSSQAAAIQNSCNNSLCIIWGPPGTGKTKTIAKAVEAHLNAGRRVLLVAHANTAVDEALEKIAQQLKPTEFYQGGGLIRLGIPRKESLEQNYPLVNLDNVVSLLGMPLIEEKMQLQKEKEQTEAFLSELQKIASCITLAKNSENECQRIEKNIVALTQRLDKAESNLQELKEQQIALMKKLTDAQAAGAVKRFLFGIDPKKIQSELNNVKAKHRTAANTRTELLNALQTEEKKLQAHKHQIQTADYENLLNKRGLTVETLQERLKAEAAQLAKHREKETELDKALGNLAKHVLDNASLIATTLTKTFSSQHFPDKPFDVLIVDEASMAPLPLIFWAAAKTKQAITIVGDFKQLPPIFISEEPLARKWLGRSIFDVLKISEVTAAADDARVSLLDTQYRMHPAISTISNRLFYNGLLKDDHSTNSLMLQDPFAHDKALTLINTAAANPWSSQLASGGRFNLYSALLTVTLARKLLVASYSRTKTPQSIDRIGIITPYRAQARLMSKIADDYEIRDFLYINTVHSFQGGEEKIILFDCVEGPGAKKWSLLDDKRDGSDARLLLNVALTRARYKVFLIANKEYLISSLHKETALRQIINIFTDTGTELPSSAIVDDYITTNFDSLATTLSSPDITAATSSFHTDRTFWPAFLNDLTQARKDITIMSPFISLNRTGRMLDLFQSLTIRGVKILVYTRPPQEQQGSLAEHAGRVISQLQKMNIKVVLRKAMHQKIILIDNNIAWEGSLNVLSHRDTEEHMRRLIGQSTVNEIIRNLQIGNTGRM